jgi:hypothetical protein
VLKLKLQPLRPLQEHQLLMAKRNKRGRERITGNQRRVRPPMVRQKALSNQNIELKVRRAKIKRPKKEKLQLTAKAKSVIENQRIRNKMVKKMAKMLRTDQMSQSIESREKRLKERKKKENNQRKRKRSNQRKKRI